MKFFLAEKLPEELRQYLKLIQESHWWKNKSI